MVQKQLTLNNSYVVTNQVQLTQNFWFDIGNNLTYASSISPMMKVLLYHPAHILLFGSLHQSHY